MMLRLVLLISAALTIAGCASTNRDEEQSMATNPEHPKLPTFERTENGFRIQHYSEYEKTRKPWHSHWENLPEFAETEVLGFLKADHELVVKADNAVYLWDLNKGKSGTKLSYDFLYTAALQPEAALCATVDESSLSVRDLRTSLELWRHANSYHGTNDLAFSPDGLRLSHWAPTGSGDRYALEVLDSQTGNSHWRIELGPGYCQGFRFEWSSDGKYILAFDSSRTGDELGDWAKLVLIDSTKGKRTVEFNLQASPSHGGISPNGKLVFAASGSETRVWDADTGRSVMTTPSVLGAWKVTNGTGASEASLICASYKLWGVESQQAIRDFKDLLDATQIYDLSVAPNSRWLSAATNKGLQVWEFAEGRTVLLDRDTRFVTSAKYSTDLAWIAYSGLNGVVRIRGLAN